MNFLIVYSNGESCLVRHADSLQEACQDALDTVGDEILTIAEARELTDKELPAARYVSRYEVKKEGYEL